jgi:hypothetical protein
MALAKHSSYSMTNTVVLQPKLCCKYSFYVNSLFLQVIGLPLHAYLQLSRCIICEQSLVFWSPRHGEMPFAEISELSICNTPPSSSKTSDYICMGHQPLNLVLSSGADCVRLLDITASAIRTHNLATVEIMSGSKYVYRLSSCFQFTCIHYVILEASLCVGCYQWHGKLRHACDMENLPVTRHM